MQLHTLVKKHPGKKYSTMVMDTTIPQNSAHTTMVRVDGREHELKRQSSSSRHYRCTSAETQLKSSWILILHPGICSQCVTWWQSVWCRVRAWTCGRSSCSWRTCQEDGPKTHSPPRLHPCRSRPGRAPAAANCEARTRPHPGQERGTTGETTEGAPLRFSSMPPPPVIRS